MNMELYKVDVIRSCSICSDLIFPGDIAGVEYSQFSTRKWYCEKCIKELELKQDKEVLLS